MKRTLAVLFAALQSFASLETAAGAPAQAVAAFPEVRLQPETNPSHTLAYATLLAGAAMIGASYEFERRADREYARYRDETDVARIGTLYDRTINLDRWSNATLLGGEALLAAGVYLRFLRRPAPSHVVLTAGITRCSVTWRF
jgi:hypothetical protein